MNNAQGGYRIIDLKGIDLINEETPNTNIYKAIEESYKSKALLLSNIVIDNVEYNAVFKEIKHIDNYYTFEMYDRIIKVYTDKVESMPNIIIKTIDYNTLENSDVEDIKQINISTQQSSRITITNFEQDKKLYIYFGSNINEGLYSYIVSQPFSVTIDEEPTNTSLSIVSYSNLINSQSTYMQFLFKNDQNSSGKIIIDVNKVNNTFIINILNNIEL